MLATKQQNPRTVLARVLCLLFVLSLLLTGCGSTESTVSTSEYINPTVLATDSVKTTESYRGDFIIGFETTTKMTCLRITNLLWEYSGDKYISINVRRGDLVSKGDVLAEIEVNISESERLQKQLNLTEAYSSVNEINSYYNQQINDMTAGLVGLEGTAYSIAAKELEILRDEYSERLSSASQRVASAEAEIAKLEEHEKTNQIVAPYDGYIGDVIWGWQEGNTVPTGQPLIVIADISTLAFRVTNTNPYGSVPYLSEVTLIDQRNNSEYTGTVVSCRDLTGSEEDDLVIIPNIPEGEIGPLTGSVKIQGTVLNKENVILVNAEALTKDGDDYYVLVLKDGTAVSKTYVMVGAIANGVAWITDGLDEGETLVLN